MRYWLAKRFPIVYDWKISDENNFRTKQWKWWLNSTWPIIGEIGLMWVCECVRVRERVKERCERGKKRSTKNIRGSKEENKKGINRKGYVGQILIQTIEKKTKGEGLLWKKLSGNQRGMKHDWEKRGRRIKPRNKAVYSKRASDKGNKDRKDRNGEKKEREKEKTQEKEKHRNIFKKRERGWEKRTGIKDREIE